MTRSPPRCQTVGVATPAVAEAPAFVGRTREIERVRSVVDGARAGRMGALLVSGDAGVGKTRLVERVCAGDAAPDLVVLSGACLPMGATTVPDRQTADSRC